jgi:hypothetical protein
LLSFFGYCTLESFEKAANLLTRKPLAIAKSSQMLEGRLDLFSPCLRFPEISVSHQSFQPGFLLRNISGPDD